MALGIPTSNILQPGNISLTGGVTRQLVSDLQLLTPQYYKNYRDWETDRKSTRLNSSH